MTRYKSANTQHEREYVIRSCKFIQVQRAFDARTYTYKYTIKRRRSRWRRVVPAVSSLDRYSRPLRSRDFSFPALSLSRSLALFLRFCIGALSSPSSLSALHLSSLSAALHGSTHARKREREGGRERGRERNRWSADLVTTTFCGPATTRDACLAFEMGNRTRKVDKSEKDRARGARAHTYSPFPRDFPRARELVFCREWER